MSNLKVVINDSNKTMSSVDIVKLINSERKIEGNDKVLLHKQFLEKCSKVIGLELSQKFGSVYKDGSGKENRCLALPERESILMVMSYSYALQAKVYDAYKELESKQTPQTFIEAMQLATALLIEKEALEAKIEPMQIKLDYHNCHATVTKGYGLQGKAINLIDAAKIGRKLSRISREHNITIYKAVHERWGAVNSYHFDAWVELGVDLYECDKV